MRAYVRMSVCACVCACVCVLILSKLLFYPLEYDSDQLLNYFLAFWKNTLAIHQPVIPQRILGFLPANVAWLKTET